MEQAAQHSEKYFTWLLEFLHLNGGWKNKQTYKQKKPDLLHMLLLTN